MSAAVLHLLLSYISLFISYSCLLSFTSHRNCGNMKTETNTGPIISVCFLWSVGTLLCCYRWSSMSLNLLRSGLFESLELTELFSLVWTVDKCWAAADRCLCSCVVWGVPRTVSCHCSYCLAPSSVYNSDSLLGSQGCRAEHALLHAANKQSVRTLKKKVLLEEHDLVACGLCKGKPTHNY